MSADKELHLCSCPMCGGRASLGTTKLQRIGESDKYETFVGHSVNCIECGVTNRGIAEGFQTPEHAAEHWNRRAAAPHVAAQADDKPGRIPALEQTRINAEYWMAEARKINVGGAEKQICMEQAANAWKNAAYAAHDRLAALSYAPTIEPGTVKAALVWGLHRGVVESGDLDRIAISGAFNLNTVAEYLSGRISRSASNDDYARGRVDGFDAGLLKGAQVVEREADACDPSSPAAAQNWPFALKQCAAKIRKLVPL